MLLWLVEQAFARSRIVLSYSGGVLIGAAVVSGGYRGWEECENKPIKCRKNKAYLPRGQNRNEYGRWLRRDERGARRPLICPSRFSHRSHRENRAGRLLPWKNMGEERMKMQKQTHCEHREQWSRGSARDLEFHKGLSAKTNPLRPDASHYRRYVDRRQLAQRRSRIRS
jgi:hypothetical protein